MYIHTHVQQVPRQETRVACRQQLPRSHVTCSGSVRLWSTQERGGCPAGDTLPLYPRVYPTESAHCGSAAVPTWSALSGVSVVYIVTGTQLSRVYKQPAAGCVVVPNKVMGAITTRVPPSVAS